MRVLKFGGTSVVNAECFIRIVNISEIKAQKGQVAIVLSAPAKVTDYLVSIIEKTVIGCDTLLNIKYVKHIFTELIEELSMKQSDFPLKQLKLFLEYEFKQIKQLLGAIRSLGRCPDNINASLVCRGEKLSIAIIAGLLEARGHKLTIINPVKKLLAVGSYLNSVIDIDESIRRIANSKIPSNHIILMAGFIAGNKRGEPVLLGRNSSDYSAAILAACLRADFCEIWTDVDGIYNYDPRQVTNAKLLGSISYREAIELSYFGAKILHPYTIPLIAQLQIPCLIKNTNNPHLPGTLISISNKKKYH